MCQMNLLPLMTTILKTEQFCRNCLQVAIESANRMLKRALPNGTRDINRRIRYTAPRQYFKYLSKGLNPAEPHCMQNVSCTHLTITIPTKLEKTIHRLSELHETIFGYVFKFDFPGFTTIESCGSLHACRLSLAVLDRKGYRKDDE